MAMAGIFGLFCATYYWFPLLANGRTLSERLGKLHFWLTLILAYTTFLPMYFGGLAGEPRHYAQLTGLNAPAQALLGSTRFIQLHITFAGILLGLTQLLFIANLILTLRSPRRARQNPWSATTMEWAPHALDEIPDLPQDTNDLPAPIVYRGPCDYSDDGLTFRPQWEPPSPPAPQPE
jgi:cytochrome c oxidase subunit 1